MQSDAVEDFSGCIREGPSHPFERGPAREFFEAHNVPQARMRFLWAGVRGVWAVGFSDVISMGVSVGKVVTAFDHGIFKAFVFDREVRVGYVLGRESMRP